MDRVAVDDPRVQEIAAEELRARLSGVPAVVADTLVAAQLTAKFGAFDVQHPDAVADLIPDRGYRVVSRAEGAIRLCDIGVARAARGSGCGTVLLQGLLEEADAAGAALELSVWHDAPARAWYERHGFVAVGGDPQGHLEMRREYCSIHSVA